MTDVSQNRSGLRARDCVVIGLITIVCVAILLPIIVRVREQARRMHSQNNLKQLGLGLHCYHDVYSVFPPGGVVDFKGRGHHGWHAMTLPYMQASPLYSQIDFNHPWHAIPNRFRSMSDLEYLRIPGQPKCAAGFPATHYAINQTIAGQNSSVRLKDVINPNSTWLCAESAGAFRPWADAFNWRTLNFPLGASSTSVGHPTGTGGNLQMVDGSVRWFDASTSAEVLKAMSGNPRPLPVATPAQRLDFTQYANAQILHRSLALDGSLDDGPIPRVNGIVIGGRTEWVEFFVYAKGGVRELTIADMRVAAKKFPDARAISFPATLNDEVVGVLRQFSELQFAAFSDLDVSPTALRKLATMDTITTLRFQKAPAPAQMKSLHSMGIAVEIGN